MPRISVVIATYRSFPEFQVVVDSLDAQTLDQSEFEVIVVDDGSPDDTIDRLRAVADVRANWRVERIDNTGWPGAARNVGIDLATAPYVFFADHDDPMFPEALSAMADFAEDSAADVVHPKECVRGWQTPGWASWRQQTELVEALDQDLLQCITPHKLYRLGFLREHGIRFPEGKVRLEDFSFNAEVWSRSPRIGVLANVACYVWVIHETNSHKDGYDYESYWQNFEESLRPIEQNLDPGAWRDQLLVRWYRSRILERLGPSFGNLPDETAQRFLGTFRDLLPHFPEHLDPILTPADQARSQALRGGSISELKALSDADRDVRLGVTPVRSYWDGTTLRLTLRIQLVSRDSGDPIEFERVGGGVRRVLPAVVGDAADVDFAQALDESFADVVVRQRETSIDWIVDSRSDLNWVDLEDGLVTPELLVHSEMDVCSAAGGQRLTPDVWDVFVRWNGHGLTHTTWVPTRSLTLPLALIDGTPWVPYATKSGNLAVDSASRVRTLVGSARPELSDARDVENGSALTLPRVHVVGSATIDGTIELDGVSSPATIVADGSGADLVLTASRIALSSADEVRARFWDRRSHPLPR